MNDDNVKFYDLPPSAFPIEITYFDMETEKVLKTDKILGIGAYEVPAFGRPTGVRLRYADGKMALSNETT